MSTIAENIANIRAQMADAAKKAGRDPSEILLCAATKMNDADRVKEAVAAGVDCCGENRVQEIQAKRPLGAYTGKPLHFIGHLQTNKVKYLVGVVDLIESVDRPELLECIEKQAEKVGRCAEHSLRGQHRCRGKQIRVYAGRSRCTCRPHGGFSACGAQGTDGNSARERISR